MAKSGKLKGMPKTHTIQKALANEMYQILFSGKDKNFKKEMMQEITHWLDQQNVLIDENPAELAQEWAESRGGMRE